jgi:hypothetical protein
MGHYCSPGEEKNNVLKDLSVGYNHTRCYHDNCTTHAEMDAIDKLKIREKKKKLFEINILVIRVNNSGNLCSSKPCSKCISYMKTNAVKKGYKIKKVFYSTSTGSIENKLLNLI